MREGRKALPQIMKIAGFIKYCMILLVLSGLALAYGWKNHLLDRYQAHLERERQIAEFRNQIGIMHDRAEASRNRVKQLDVNPVEKEAAVRRIKGWTRPGETVYRVEETPSNP